jgi:methionyl-tRNA formyltransferase
MRVIFFGTPLFAVPTLERLLDHDQFEVIGVVTQPDKRRGRGKQLIPSAVKKVALTHDLQVWQPPRIKKDLETITQLQSAQADVFVVVAYGQILSQEILSIPPYGCINVHGSLLPKYRGAAPIQWCLYNGESETGITTMQMDVGMDTGDMLQKVHRPILLSENAQDLAISLSAIGADLLLETLLKLKHGAIIPIPQNEDEATYSPLIGKKDYELDWTKSALAIHNQIRGFYPNCVTTFRDQTLKVKATEPLGDEYWSQLPEDFQTLASQWDQMAAQGGKPGEIIYIAKNLGAVVHTGEGLLLLTEVQLAGKRTQSGWDFANGTRLEVGEMLG